MIFDIVSSITDILNTKLFIYSGVTLTVGGVLIPIVKAIIPAAKSNRKNAKEIQELRDRIARLEDAKEINDTKQIEQDAKINEIIRNSPNKKIKKISATTVKKAIDTIEPIIEEEVKKVKVKKAKK